MLRDLLHSMTQAGWCIMAVWRSFNPQLLTRWTLAGKHMVLKRRGRRKFEVP